MGSRYGAALPRRGIREYSPSTLYDYQLINEVELQNRLGSYSGKVLTLLKLLSKENLLFSVTWHDSIRVKHAEEFRYTFRRYSGETEDQKKKE